MPTSAGRSVPPTSAITAPPASATTPSSTRAAAARWVAPVGRSSTAVSRLHAASTSEATITIVARVPFTRPLYRRLPADPGGDIHRAFSINRPAGAVGSQVAYGPPDGCMWEPPS